MARAADESYCRFHGGAYASLPLNPDTLFEPHADARLLTALNRVRHRSGRCTFKADAHIRTSILRTAVAYILLQRYVIFDRTARL